MQLHSPVVRPASAWRAALSGLVLIGSVAATACSSTAVATSSALPTPVPPTALSTLPPAKPPHPASAASGPAISIENFNYVSADLTVPAGASVIWTNHDDVDHTVTASDASFSSPSIPTDGQYSYTFTTPGTYSYFCAIHPFMTARVTVQ